MKSSDETPIPQTESSARKQATFKMRYLERHGESWVSTKDIVEYLVATANFEKNKGIVEQACLAIASYLKEGASQ